MTPGRELDALIAEKVMGCPPWPKRDGVTDDTASVQYWSHRILPRFSDNIADAWLVVEKMRIGVAPTPNGKWVAFIGPAQIHEGVCDDLLIDEWFEYSAVADTVPLAICLAALKVVGYTHEL